MLNKDKLETSVEIPLVSMNSTEKKENKWNTLNTKKFSKSSRKAMTLIT